MKQTIGFGVVLLALVMAPCARATATYTYTGNPFTSTVGSPGLPGSAAISASFTLTSALGPNLNFFTVPSVLSWSIGDGTNSISSGTELLQFSTNSLGAITNWYFEGYNSTLFFGTFGPPTVSFGFTGGPYNLNDESANTNTTTMAYNTNPGSWAQASSVPEPSTSALLLLPLAWVAASRVRRRKAA